MVAVFYIIWRRGIKKHKKQLLFWSLLLFTFCIGNAQININIPDPNFKPTLLNHEDPVVDTNGDGEVSEQEALAVTSLIMRDKGITDLTGIEKFTNLDVLVVAYNHIDEVNVTHNTKLTVLNLIGSNLTEIDVSN